MTDHKPLTSILGPKKGIPSLAAAHLQLWAVLLSSYHYEIEYKSRLSISHGNADGLLRLPIEASGGESLEQIEITLFNIAQLSSLYQCVMDSTYTCVHLHVGHEAVNTVILDYLYCCMRVL